MNTKNGKKPLDEETRAKIEETLMGEVESAPKESDRVSQSNKSLAKSAASKRVNQETSEAAETLVKADKTAKRVRLREGYKRGLAQAQDIRTGEQLGLLKGLTGSTIEDTKQLCQQLKRLEQYIDEESGEEIASDLNRFMQVGKDATQGEESDPLEELTDLLGEDSLKLPNSKAFNLFDWE